MSMSFEALSGFSAFDDGGKHGPSARIGHFAGLLTSLVKRLACGVSRSASPPSVDFGPIPSALGRDIGLEQFMVTDRRWPSYGVPQTQPLWTMRPRFPATLWGLPS